MLLRKFLDMSLAKITAFTVLLSLALFAALVSSVAVLNACPFCSAVNLTFTEQLKSNDVVVIAKLIEIPKPSEDPDDELPKAEFEIVDVIKGKKWVKAEMKFKTLLVGRYPEGQQFLVMGVDPPSVAWSTPMKASERVINYLKKLDELPKSGAERLAFFQDYFEDKESVLAFDAYDEFAKAPYEDLIALKDQMDHPKLINWIKSPETSINRRRLYFTMLGVCGKAADIEMLEGFIKSGDRKQQAGLDALIACYLNLKGADGVKLVEETFIKDTTVDYVDTLGAVSALRFHGTEVEVVPKERIIAAIRLLLDRPKMADMIIPDLARWEDWSVMDRLVQMFKDADEDTNWLRVPVITYLRACPKPEAPGLIEELSKIDPDAVRRADFFLDFGDDEFGDDEDDEDEMDDDSIADSGEAVESGDTDQESADSKSGNQDPSKVEPDSEKPGPAPASEEKVEETENSSGGQFLENVEETLTSLPVGDTDYVVRKIPLNESLNEANAKLMPISTENQSPSDAVTNSVPTEDVPAEDTVSVSADSMAIGPITGPQSEIQLAQVVPAPPVAAVEPQQGITLLVIFVPFAVSVGIFVLLWSVINGWFERLIV